MSSTLEYLRQYYHMPFLKRGLRCDMDGKPGIVTSFSRSSAYVRVRFDGERHSHPCHPTWAMTYYDKEGNMIKNYKEGAQHS